MAGLLAAVSSGACFDFSLTESYRILSRRAGRLVAGRIAGVLDADDCRFLPDAVPPVAAAVLHRDGTVHRAGTELDVDREGLPSVGELCVPVRAGGGGRGHFRVTAASRVARPGREQRRVAVLLADQMAGVATAGDRPPPERGAQRPGADTRG